MKTIQMVSISKEKGLFILDFNIETGEITFKVSTAPENIQKEIITVDNDIVYTKDYNFSIGYLQKFVNENKIK